MIGQFSLIEVDARSEGSAKFLLISSLRCPRLATLLGLDVHRTSTACRDRFRSGLEPLLLSGLAGFPGCVHPASTARSIVSVSSSETACWRQAEARSP